jgi:hypothetical protein
MKEGGEPIRADGGLFDVIWYLGCKVSLRVSDHVRLALVGPRHLHLGFLQHALHLILLFLDGKTAAAILDMQVKPNIRIGFDPSGPMFRISDSYHGIPHPPLLETLVTYP